MNSQSAPRPPRTERRLSARAKQDLYLFPVNAFSDIIHAARGFVNSADEILFFRPKMRLIQKRFAFYTDFTKA